MYSTNLIFHILTPLLFFILVINLVVLFITFFIFLLVLGFIVVLCLTTLHVRDVQCSFVTFGRCLVVMVIRIGFGEKILARKAFFLFRLFVFLHFLVGGGLELLLDIFLGRVRLGFHFMEVFVF